MIDRTMIPAYLNMGITQSQFDMNMEIIQSQLNHYRQNQILQENLNCLHSSRSQLYQDLINCAPNKEMYDSDKEVKRLIKQINDNDIEIKRLIKQINDIIEYEDEKQKILKITAPEVLKDINADTVIVYGNISGNIKAKNVVCVKDLCEKQNENIETKLVIPSESDIKKVDYHNNHPDCYHCKFCKKGRYYPYLRSCGITDKDVKKYGRIRARLCKYYESKGD